MIVEKAPTEYVQTVADEAYLQVLQNQFERMHQLFAEFKFIPEATFESLNGIKRYLSGIPMHNFNVLMGVPDKEMDADAFISQQMNYFAGYDVPFYWYVDESASPDFKEKLKKHGFIDEGINRGVFGHLDKPIANTSIPEDCVLELVTNEMAMDEFNDLVCTVFGVTGINIDAYRDFSWKMAQNKKEPIFYHWVARKNGKVVSAVSTMVLDGVASFWNGASSPDVRKQGLSTALRRFALQHAISLGAKYGSSYLMSEGLAFGICSKLGYETKWRFHAFLSPAAKD